MGSTTTTALFSRYNSPPPLIFLLLSLFITLPLVRSGDADTLLALKPSLDPLNNVLQWGVDSGSNNVCEWQGVKECINGRVIKLVVERLNLSGTLDGSILNQLDQIRVLSFKENSLSGRIPELSSLKNLKSLFLNNNKFSGEIPVSLSSIHRLKIIVLSGNRLSGQIPRTLLDLSRLYVLFLQDNRLTGTIPPFNQSSLRFFNVSRNFLSGKIPLTPSIKRFNESSFVGNVYLCGEQIRIPCNNIGPSASPAYPIVPNKSLNHRNRTKKLLKIILPTLGGFALLCILVILFLICIEKPGKENDTSSKTIERGGVEAAPSGSGGGGNNENEVRKGGGFSWDQEGEGLGSLVFVGPDNDQLMGYSLEDLLKASAETLGRGTIGSTYKALLESGYIVTVKRLKDSMYPSIEEFERHIEILGRLRHPNVVPFRAYFQAKEERLLVYDYFPNGSLFSLVHGTQGSGGSKPLHWTSCLKIAEDLAMGLSYVHQNPGLTHGNLKSTNVLLGSDFESCLTDYGLNPFKNPDTNEEPSASTLFYRAPECRDVRKPMTQQADVYSYGVLLLELLTGKTPFQDLVREYGSDIPSWVRSVREEETDSGDEPNDASEEKLNALVNIAMQCVSVMSENRPLMKDVLRMIREARTDARGSSNSSDHSPGRWSDTVLSLPRDEPLSI